VDLQERQELAYERVRDLGIVDEIERVRAGRVVGERDRRSRAIAAVTKPSRLAFRPGISSRPARAMRRSGEKGTRTTAAPRHGMTYVGDQVTRWCRS